MTEFFVYFILLFLISWLVSISEQVMVKVFVTIEQVRVKVLRAYHNLAR